MPKPPFSKGRRFPISLGLLDRIRERMSAGDYRAVERIFGAAVGPRPEDDAPVTIEDLPRFGQAPVLPEAPADYSQHLDDTYALLRQMREAQHAGDRARLAALAESVDWATVADEFETVAGCYRMEVRERATRIMVGLVSPLAYEDAVELRIEGELLAAALDESPSLLERAEQDLQAAWKAVRLRDDALPVECPWPTLAAMRQGLDAALAASGLAIDADEPTSDNPRTSGGD